MTITIPEHWHEAERLWAAADPTFAHRPAQAAAAGLMHDAFRTRTHTALDLPVGSGKSMCALVTAEHAKGRTVVSTATKALQSQLRLKDIPNLQAAGILTREIVVLEGRSNYGCINRAVHELDKVQPAAKKTVRAVIKHLKKNPDAARRDEIPVAVPDWLWSRLCSDSDACSALQCQMSGSSCAYTQVRNRARASDIVVANHSLVLADAQIKGGDPVSWGLKSPTEGEAARYGVLGPYKNLILDEAHALENAAEAFGEQRVTIRGIQALMTRISKQEMSGAAIRHMATTLDELNIAMLGLPTGALLAPTGKEEPIFEQAADAAHKAGEAIRGGSASFEKNVSAEILVAACYSLSKKLTAIDTALRTGSDQFGPRAVSVDSPPGSRGATGIRSQLVDAGPWLQRHLWGMVTTVAMSGTLAVPGNRDWVTDRIGLKAPVTVFPTSFDLRKQRLVYVTPRVEAKGAMSARSTDADVRELEQLIEASNGRALVLFPANVDLKFVHDHLRISHTLLAQGVTTDGRSAKGDPIPMSLAALAQRFTDDTHSVLLGTKSLFEGVDFPGEQCSLVVIVRFPNLRPDDPLVLARRNLIEGRGGNPWVELQEPAMALTFRQAAGRAIRRVDDKGVVAVIDPRSGSKSYAKRLLLSLAPSDYSDDLEDVRRFLA